MQRICPNQKPKSANRKTETTGSSGRKALFGQPQLLAGEDGRRSASSLPPAA
jgi:hypothetical protein